VKKKDSLFQDVKKMLISKKMSLQLTIGCYMDYNAKIVNFKDVFV
jgi:hypothetical protein